jgi:taurine dioxygenase
LSSSFYEHVWRPGEILMWDNRCTLHARTDFSSSERRLLRRVTILGEKPVGDVFEESGFG